VRGRVNSKSYSEAFSVFRTDAWVQAWLDTWGKESHICLIDLGGRKNSLEYLYTEKKLLRKIVPVTQLNLAGVGGALISSPRAEYNHINSLIDVCGGLFELAQEIKKNHWQEFVLRDVLQTHELIHQFQEMSASLGTYYHLQKTEPSYQVDAVNFNHYLSALGANTRLKYFNRRENLQKSGVVERSLYATPAANEFFLQLNKFHVLRWGRPCYSADSQSFMINFQERLQASGGEVIMEKMSINGEIVSVIYDVVWQGRRYNFQSGYLENRFPKIALGAIHLGYAIEAAVANNQVYDFMAGAGKNANYKASVANTNVVIKSFSLLRQHAKLIRKCYGFLNISR
jgi:hypothetical protein